jgi:hypothetical protein
VGKNEWLTLGAGEGFGDEVEGVFGAGNDELLEEVFEEFVDLVLLEVALDGVHVVVLLEFVHLNSNIW